MTWTSAIGGAVSNAYSSGWMNKVGKYATDAFSWVEKNPETANILGGVAAGIGTAYLQKEQQKDQQKFQREMYGRQREDRMIKPGEIDNYGTHVNSMTKGLLSHGMVTGD